MLKKIIPVCAVYVLCIIGVMLSSCRSLDPIAEEEKKTKAYELKYGPQDATPEGNDIYTKCIKGHWFVFNQYRGGVVQLLIEKPGHDAPQPVTCEK